MNKRVSEVQAKISLRKANEERQYGQGAVPRFGNSAGKIIDLFEGVYDLKTRVLRTPLDPMITLLDDPLRMLRGLRFSITKGFIIDSELWDSMLDPRVLDKLKEVVSHERMREEITKMMKHDTLGSLKLLGLIPGLMEVIFKDGMWLMPTTKH